jgi:hypothetical protein
LHAIKKYREEGWTIIYEDKTFIHSSDTRPKNWTDGTRIEGPEADCCSRGRKPASFLGISRPETIIAK